MIDHESFGPMLSLHALRAYVFGSRFSLQSPAYFRRGGASIVAVACRNVRHSPLAVLPFVSPMAAVLTAWLRALSGPLTLSCLTHCNVCHNLECSCSVVACP